MYLFRKSKGRKCIKSRRTFKKTKSPPSEYSPGKIGGEQSGPLASGTDWPKDPPAILRGKPLHQSGLHDSLGMPGFPGQGKGFCSLRATTRHARPAPAGEAKPAAAFSLEDGQEGGRHHSRPSPWRPVAATASTTRGLSCRKTMQERVSPGRNAAILPE